MSKTQAAAATRVLVSCPGSQQLHFLSVDSKGKLDAGPQNPLDLESKCGPVAGHKNLVYVGCTAAASSGAEAAEAADAADASAASFIRVLEESEDGSEFVLRPELVPTAGPPTYLAVSPCGKFLVSASYEADLVAVAPIAAAADGTATLPGPPSQVVKNCGKAHCCVYRPNGETLDSYEIWVACLGLNCVKIFEQSKKTGELRETNSLNASVKDAGPRHVIFHPSLPVAYVVNELEGSLDSFHSETGKLLGTNPILPARDFVGRRWAAHLSISSDGRQLCVSERCNHTVTVFTVGGGDGKLTRAAVVKTDAEQPRAMVMLEKKNVLLVAGEKTHNVVAYAVNVGGNMQKTGEIAVGSGPLWIHPLRSSGRCS